MDSRADESSAKTQKSAINVDLEAAFQAELARQRERFARAEKGLLEPGASLREAGRALESWLSEVQLPGGLGWHKAYANSDTYFLGYYTFHPSSPLDRSPVKYLSVGIYTGSLDYEDDEETEYMRERAPWLECSEYDGAVDFRAVRDRTDHISMTMDDVDSFLSPRVASALRRHAARVVEGVAPPPFVRQPRLERINGPIGLFLLLVLAALGVAGTALLGAIAGLPAEATGILCIPAAFLASIAGCHVFAWLQKRPLREAAEARESAATP